MTHGLLLRRRGGSEQDDFIACGGREGGNSPALC
jgi:hypothetical protein